MGGTFKFTDLPDIFLPTGGAISLSFGGFLQNKDTPRQHIQQACNESNALADVIKSAMSKYQTHNLEFDIEVRSLYLP